MTALAVLDRCAPAAPVVLGALAATLRPTPRLSIADWATDFRKVSAEGGSRYPGDWRNDRSPHLVAIMDALGADDPAEDVVFKKSAQVGGSEVGINFIGHVIAQDPGPMVIVLPSHDESIKYVRIKLQPTIDESPALRRRVREMTNRAERGSTAAFKSFPGGFAQITFAGSSKGLQMLSAKYVVGDEISEWPAEAGERGDPVDQVKTRTNIYERDRKRFWVSTPGIAGVCRISAMYEASDRMQRYVPCPQCGAYQVLRFQRLKWDSATKPHRAWFECAANGCVIAHVDKPAMLAAGEWIATAGEDGPPDWFEAEDLGVWKARRVPGRARGFYLWQAGSLFTSWDGIVAAFLAAKGNHEKMRVFTQQVLGEAWEDRGDAPEAEKLHAMRVVEFRKGLPPVGPVAFTGAVDVQGNRLEWAVWGWSEGMTRWLVDWGIVAGDPNLPETWAAMGRIMATARYAPGGGAPCEVEAWAVDSGYVSPAVYQFVRGRPRTFAVDGRRGATHPMVGTPKDVDIKWSGRKVKRGAKVWPVGGHGLKSNLYASIRLTIAGPDANGAWPPGAMILPGDVDLAYCEQLTAEHLVRKELKTGVYVMSWEKLLARPNEALDIACYARAMAYHLKYDRLTPEDWAALRAERAGSAVQGDLFAGEVRVPDPVPTPRTPDRARSVDGEDNWVSAGEDWLL